MTNTSVPTPNERFEFSLEHWQERFVLGILRVACVFGLVSMVAVFNPSTSMFLRIFYGVVYLVLLVSTLAPLPYLWRAGFALSMGYLFGVSEMLAGGLVGAARLYLIATVVLANLLFSYRASIITLIINTMTYIVLGWAIVTNTYQPTLPIAIPGTIYDWIASGATFIFIAVTINAAIQMLQNEFQRAYERGRNMLAELNANRHTLEDRVAERTSSLEKRTAELSATNLLAQRIAATKEIGSLLAIVADLIAEKYGYYHVGIYLLDENREHGYLQAASSEAGKQMLARGDQIQTSGKGLVETCVSQRRIQMEQEIEAKTAESHFPELRLTRSRAAIPVRVRDQIIGALDVHSQSPAAFPQSALEALQSVADLLGLAMENARLFDEMQSIIEQMQHTSGVRSYQAWSELTKRGSPVYQYTPLGIQMIGAALESRPDPDNLQVPIILRGQKIGRIQLKRKGTGSGWLEQERLLVQEVATQVALALENARLLNDAQRRAVHERVIGEVTARIGAAFDVDTVLRTTAQEIGKALGDAEVSIHLQKDGKG